MAGPGQGVAAAFGAGQVGDLGVVDEAGCFPDADDAPAFDAGVPSTGGAYPNVMRRTLAVRAGDEPVAVLGAAVGILEQPQVRLVDGDQQVDLAVNRKGAMPEIWQALAGTGVALDSREPPKLI